MDSELKVIENFMGEVDYKCIEYNSGWAYWMPIVEYIEEIEEPHPSNNPEKGTVWPYQVEILSRNVVQIVDNTTDDAIVTVEHGECETKLESIRKAVLLFINWYNSKNL